MTAQASVTARGPAGLRIVVTVGTDHHPFDRLIGWTNDWLGQHPEQIPAFFVQSGAASVAPACAGSPFLEVSRLSSLLDSADAIVCHGGPASMADAWARGQLPIVVPRMPQLGEHIDDHQVDFCRKIAQLGRIRLAQTYPEFAGLLDEAGRDRTRFRASIPNADIDAAVARFGALVDELVSRPPRRPPLIRRGWPDRRRPAAGPDLAAAASTRSPGVIPEANTNGAPGPSPRTGLAGVTNEEHE